MNQLFDAVTLDAGTVRRTGDGYLAASALSARTGIQLYRGAEVGKPHLDVVRVYRPPEEVFAKDAMHSFAWRPLTVDHPREAVTADNWKRLAVGQTGDEVARDGDAIRVPLVLMDAAAIRAVENGKRELSWGYTADLKWGDGKTPAGEAYDAIQTNIRANHLAVVAAARGGSALRIGDAAGDQVVRNAFDSVHPGVGTLHRPGPRVLATSHSDAQAEAERVSARDRMIADLGQAWRAPPAESGSARDSKPPERTTDAAAARDAAWGGMVKDLSEAWRRG